MFWACSFLNNGFNEGAFGGFSLRFRIDLCTSPFFNVVSVSRKKKTKVFIRFNVFKPKTFTTNFKLHQLRPQKQIQYKEYYNHDA